MEKSKTKFEVHGVEDDSTHEMSPAESQQEYTEKLAGKLYETYNEAVGGKAYNGDPLPTWTEFGADPSKTVQYAAWIKVAHKAMFG